jgi:glycosyltransferase involved in cell wall biosynthesis
MVSKALVVGTYRQKLTELARLGVDITAVVPPYWREGGSTVQLEAADDDGYRLITSPLRWNGHFHFHYYPELARIVRGERPDLLHMDEEPYNLATYLGVRAARAQGVRSVFFTWQNLRRRYPPPFSVMERQVYRWSAGAIAGSEEAGKVLRAKGYSGPLTVAPQFGVDPTVFSPGERAPGPFRVGFLNRLVAAKGPLLTLEAFATLPAESVLVVVGDGPLRPELERSVSERGLEHRVQIRSRVPSAEVRTLMRQLDVVVLPSLTTREWKEQFGRVLTEAMSSGVPVIGSNSGEIPRVIGDAGLVVPEKDVGALGAALRRLYDDPGLRADLAKRGRERVLRYFTNARVAECTHEAYLAALAAS